MEHSTESDEIEILMGLAADEGRPACEDNLGCDSDLGPILRLLGQVRAVSGEAHALACRRRRVHPVDPDDPINRVQRSALDHAVLKTLELSDEAQSVWAHVKAIHPSLLTGFQSHTQQLRDPRRRISGPGDGQA